MESIRKVNSEIGRHPTTLLCIYGFFSMMRPSEPFLTPYLTGHVKNLTVTNEVFPVWTYSYLVILMPVFLTTDCLRYKPIIILQGISYILTWVMLLFAQGVLAMQFMEFLYGMVTATEIAYFSYIYSIVNQDRYQKVTSYCRSIQLCGFTLASVMGQLLISLVGLDYFYLNVITLVSCSIALIFSFLLPMPKRSMFFHKTETEVAVNSQLKSPYDVRTHNVEDFNSQDRANVSTMPTQVEVPKNRFMKVLRQLLNDIITCYSTGQIFYWSLWWALATCGYNQVVNYTQVLWEHVQPSGNLKAYNGGVEAISTLMGAATSFFVSVIRIEWSLWGELTLGIVSFLDAGALFLMNLTQNIWICYAAYLVFKALYMLLITIATFQIAATLSIERYALNFGINTFVALCLQTIVTIIVVDSRGLSLDIVSQVSICVYLKNYTMDAPSFNRHLIVVEGFACPNDPRSSVVRGFMPLVGPPKANWS
uniref:Solute carrier family 19 member 3 n=1 Tax=Erpetoichthys calabaricus TaxID=27687 RepID=A0A8C4SR41_ERPCA